MDKAKSAVDELIKNIFIAIKAEIRKNNKTRTYVIIGKIKSINDDGHFNVIIRDKEHIVKSHFTHQVGDSVSILVANGNYNNLFIIY